MQGDVESHSAIGCSVELYAALAAEQPVDVAVARARSALQWSDKHRTGEWALPKLTVRAEPDRVLGLPAPLDADGVLRARGGSFENLRWMVDRNGERREVWRRLEPDPTRPAGPAVGDNLVILSGKERVGKSTLARSCVLVAQLRGLPVVHVKLLEDRTVTWWTLLEAVPSWLDGNGAQPATEKFRAELAAIMTALQPPVPGALVPAPLTVLMRPDVLRPGTATTGGHHAEPDRAGLSAAGTVPLVVLDIAGPPRDSELLRQLLARNDFAHQLVALGHVETALAAGLASADPDAAFSVELVSLLTGGSIAAQVAGLLQAMDRPGDSFGWLLSLAGTALVTFVWPEAMTVLPTTALPTTAPPSTAPPLR